MELFKASAQWSTRPADERFSSLQEMYQVCKAYADSAVTSKVPYSELRVETVDQEVQLTGKAGKFARLTHWAFGQMSRLIGAPADYLRQLPATLAVQNLNYGLKERSNKENASDVASLMFHQNGDLLLRAITSPKYQRIWNHEIVRRLMDLEPKGWRTPPARPAFPNQPGTRPATEADVLNASGHPSLSIKVGDLIAPAGLYASDKDCFAFLINESARINDGTDEGLSRGFFVENSEVGDCSLAITSFLYRSVCGNHILWGAKNVNEIRIRHIGSASEKAWMQLAVEVKRYADSSASDLEAQIASARRYQIAATKDEVLDKLFGMRVASRKLLEQSYDEAEKNVDVDGAPNTAWGLVQGMTRVSQQSTFTDERTAIDRAASKVLTIAF